MGIKNLTAKQQKVYNFIKDKINRDKLSPTLSEIASFIDVSSLRTVTQYLEILEYKGLIKRNRHSQRGVELIKHREQGDELISAPIFASVGCGQLNVMAEQTFGEYATVAASLLDGKRDNIFVIRAVGDSMADAGINNGDLVLVERTDDVMAGDIVIAIIDDMAVMKKISFANNAVILNSVNNNSIYPPIILRKNFKVFGKLIRILETKFSGEYRYIPEPEENPGSY